MIIVSASFFKNDPYDYEQAKPKDWIYGDTKESTPDVIFLLACDSKEKLEIDCQELIELIGNTAEVIVDQPCDRPDNDKEHFALD